jgi:hypothetical protein
MSTIANQKRNLTRTRTRRWFLAVIAGVATLTLFATAALDAALPTVLSGGKDGTRTETALLASNPELAATRRSAAESAGQAEVVMLASNPELASARRYTAAEGSDAALFAANPELGLARGCVADAARQRDDTFLAANPEMMTYRRHVTGQQPAAGESEQLSCR